jgi:hypothetical protein
MPPPAPAVAALAPSLQRWCLIVMSHLLPWPALAFIFAHHRLKQN